MKPKPIQRGIQSSKARVSGDAPLIGRVSRLRDQAGNAGGHRSRGGRGVVDSPMMVAKRRLVLAWSLLLMMVTVGVIGGFILYWMKNRPAEDRGGIAVNPRSERVVSRFVSPDVDEALELVKSALAARSEAEVVLRFRPGAGGAGEVLETLRSMPAVETWKMDWMGSMDTDGQLLEGVVLTPDDDDIRKQRLAFLMPDENGVWKVDFESLARVSRPSWEEFLHGDAPRAEVRVFITRDSYFNGPFGNESEWAAYSMVSPDVPNEAGKDGDDAGGMELLRGYAKKDSPQGRAMERVFQGDVRSARVTIGIAKTPGAEARQFQITRVLSNEWVMGGMAYDERFRDDGTPPKAAGQAADQE